MDSGATPVRMVGTEYQHGTMHRVVTHRVALQIHLVVGLHLLAH